MFELSVAIKYLTPRWRQLSVSIISLISILVIALVVWLVVVFFSVTSGLTNSWIDKMIALTAPVRITPTEEYYNSYYYNVDSISGNSSYQLQSLREKLVQPITDPYNPMEDEEIPSDWPAADRDASQKTKDLVKLVFSSVASLDAKFQKPSASVFEATSAQLRLFIEKNGRSLIEQTLFLGSYDPENTLLNHSVLPITKAGIDNFHRSIFRTNDDRIASSAENKSQEFALAASGKTPALWFDKGLPTPNHFGNPILLPKSYRDAGAAVGDLGSLGFSFPTASAIQELKVPIYVAGFYDPGIIPSGGKFAIANQELVSEIRSAQGQEGSHIFPTTGINIRLADRDQADAVKAALIAQFEAKGISPYWKVDTYKDYEFSRDLIKQLGSEKRLFSLLAAIIIIVACSNIISMLIILVNDKKKEIGILRSMGATSLSIMIIFGTCGIVMGVAGSLIGTLAAFVTLQNLQSIVDLISRIQGYEMFNPLFYGDTLPSKISVEAFMFVVGVTGIISLLAGVIPAVKACLLKPSATLRAE